MSRMGASHVRVDRRIIGQGIEVPGNHGQWGAQFMRCIGDEVLAHRLQTHLARHIAHQKEGLPAAVGDHLQRQERIDLYRRSRMISGNTEVIAMQVVRELRRADQIIDSQSHIHRPPQSEQSVRLAVEPDDLVLGTQNDHAVRQRRRGDGTQFAIQLHEALLMVLLAPVQTDDLCDDVAPNSAELRRADLRAQAQPAASPGDRGSATASPSTGMRRPGSTAGSGPISRPRHRPNNKMPASRARREGIHIAAMG